MNADSFYTRIFDSDGLPIFTKECIGCGVSHSKKRCPDCGEERFYWIHNDSDYIQGVQP